MKYRALYRETRPEVFSEILGQDTIVKILKHQVETDSVSHAYLFTGTRGTGKTTTARILAKAVNCLADDVSKRPCGECENCRQIAEGSFVDVIEIDAASNNGVENIRELRESVNYPPAVGRKKVYIIDEVHMLSSGAFNALLKTLEEPPENVIFILATTNPEKLPQTVLSRCMRLDFRRVPQETLAEHMKDICSEKGVTIQDDALRLLASNADGSVRDSLSILEQCLSSGEKELTRETVLDFLGAVSEEFYLRLTDAVIAGDVSSAFLMLDDALADGRDVKQIMKDWMSHFRNLLIAKFVKDPEDMLNMSSENIDLLAEQAGRIDLGKINESIVTLAKAINDARYSTQARVLMEVAIVDIAGQGAGSAAVSAPSGAKAPAGAPAGTKAPAGAPAGTKAPAEPAFEEVPQEMREAYDEDPSGGGADGGIPEDVWNDIVSEAARDVPMLHILSTMPHVGPAGGELKLFAAGDMFKEKIEANANYINGLLIKNGIDAKIVCVIDSAGNGGAGDTEDSNAKVEKVREKASKFLGVDVKIEGKD